jgi:hypothetical protein
VADNTTSTFSVDLKDGTSGPAMSAANALKQLRGQLDEDTKALAAMQRAMKNLQGGTSVNVQQFRALKAQIDAKKQSIAQAQSSILSLGGSLDKASSKGGKMTSLLEQLTKQAQGMPGPMGGVVGRLESLRGLVAGGAIALGLIAIVAALAALTVAALATAAALLKYGVAQADARRSELLRLEGLTKLRFLYQATAGNAGEMQKALDQVAAGSAVGRGQLAKYNEQLYRMGLRGQNLTHALEGVAIKLQVQGEAAASSFAGWAAGAARTGHSVKKLADDVKARLGGIAAKQMLSLDVQTQKLSESFSALFYDLKIEGFLKALQMVTQLFSQNTATGRALKVLVETIFQPMVNAMETAGPIAKRFFQGLVIGALAITIGILTVRNWFKRTFGDSEILKGIDATRLALWAGVAVVSLLAGGVAALAIAFVVLASPILAVVAGIYSLYRAGQGLVQLWEGIDWSGLGTSIVQGIVGGLKSGAKWVTDAVSNLGTSAWKTFRAKLGIASPSKAFAKLGLALPQGVQVGIERGRPDVERSVGRMVDMPDAASAAPSSSPSPAAARAPSSQSTQLTFSGDIHVHTQSDKPREMAADFRRELEQVLEGVLLSLGGRIPGGA